MAALSEGSPHHGPGVYDEECGQCNQQGFQCCQGSSKFSACVYTALQWRADHGPHCLLLVVFVFVFADCVVAMVYVCVDVVAVAVAVVVLVVVVVICY